MSGSNRSRKRRHRIRGLIGIGLRRFWVKLTQTERRRTFTSVAGVALAIGIMIVILGVALGLASGTTVGGEDVDYWIVPESRTASTLVANPGGAQFGDVHVASRSIETLEDVRFASPVLIELSQLRTATGANEYVLLIGVIAHEDLTIGGLATHRLTPGDPHYARGTYNGTWTGEVILSEAARTLLNASNGDQLETNGIPANQTLRVTDTAAGDVTSGFGQAPIGVLHLAELQQLTGATTYDQADQILVSTNSSAVKPQLEQFYSSARVITRRGLTTQNLQQDLPLAMALSASLVVIVIGTLFIGTTMGLEVTTDRQQYAIMGAVGFSGWSRGIVVLSQTLAATLLGGVLGSLLGVVGIRAANELLSRYFGLAAVVQFDIRLVGYALIVSAAIGLLTAPYLGWLSNRSSIIRELQL